MLAALAVIPTTHERERQPEEKKRNEEQPRRYAKVYISRPARRAARLCAVTQREDSSAPPLPALPAARDAAQHLAGSLRIGGAHLEAHGTRASHVVWQQRGRVLVGDERIDARGLEGAASNHRVEHLRVGAEGDERRAHFTPD